MSRIRSFVSAFSSLDPSDTPLQSIEIPLIQRDYAQGRKEAKVDEIRAAFIDVLHRALSGSNPVPVSLDFVYGEIENGTLQPLDGQQRLTTLFLLHWYLASRAGLLDADDPWTHFSYATRQSARRFCERLVTANPPPDVLALSAWIRDQAWYLFVWRNDPTIQAMLVMLDAIHARFASVDTTTAWRRLADIESPAVSFHLLPLPDMGSAEDLYIKMNSRGKPLTEFENFKAHLEKTIESSPRAVEFAKKVDTEWSDVLWAYRGSDDEIDDEFVRYLTFITEICEWSDPGLRAAPTVRLAVRIEQVFADSNPMREEHLDFLFAAFDAWVGRDPTATFESFFGRRTSGDGALGQLPLFFRDGDVNLFGSCCRNYGENRGAGARIFTYGQTLMLLAVLLHISDQTDDFSPRLRVLRNLIEGSTAELRAERMERLVADTRTLILSGELPEPGNGFGVAQIDDERAKRQFLLEHSESRYAIDTLEDHPLLRGSLSAFELDASRLEARTSAFADLTRADELWSDAAAALLTFGDYQRPRGRDSRSFQFAPTGRESRDVWRALLTGTTRTELADTRRVFSEFLDALYDSPSQYLETLTVIRNTWLATREAAAEFDWRYYMVKYEGMREGTSGIYFVEGGRIGYSLCNLRAGMTQMNSRYRDAYLLSIYRELGSPDLIEDPWFVGYEWNLRFLHLAQSAIGVAGRPSGFLVEQVASDTDDPTNAESIPAPEGVEFGPVSIGQREIDGARVDSEDRVQMGVRLVRQLLEQPQLRTVTKAHN